jgi:alanyl-tRNA synthetase
MKYLLSNELREIFLEYFRSKGHHIVQSSSLIPVGDESIMFTNAGMVQFKDYFTGAVRSPFLRAVSVQKCMRAGGKHNDLENVGKTTRHHTFFEMLGNFSFGDYFKKEAIVFAWEFLIKKLELDEKSLYVTVHKNDEEGYNIWKDIVKINKGNIYKLGDKSNFWQMGDAGPCGYSSEIFFDTGFSELNHKECGLECDCGRYLEIWNLVFMQFNKDVNGKFLNLPKPSIDTGMGLERMLRVLQNVKSNYDTDVFMSYIKDIENITGKKYESGDVLYDTAVRVISDHIRTSVFLASESFFPSNEGRGYVFRRILRRLIRYSLKLNLDIDNLVYLGNTVVSMMEGFYPEIRESFAAFEKIIADEFERFKGTLSSGIKLLEDEITRLKTENIKVINGDFIFKLHDTFGFPVDIAIDAASENNLSLDIVGFERLMQVQKTYSKQKKGKSDLSGAEFNYPVTIFTGYKSLEETADLIGFVSEDGSAVQTYDDDGEVGFLISNITPFYAESGGQKGDEGVIEWGNGSFRVDSAIKTKNGIILHHGRIIGKLNIPERARLQVDKKLRTLTAANHSATHLLHGALRIVMGSHIFQQGTQVTAEKLRFDFSCPKPLLKDDLRKIETIVNDAIFSNIAVATEERDIESALNSGALHFFDEKYGDKVRIVFIGDISKEFCGGTHVERTGSIGFFKITGESSVASGIRRIEAVTGYNYLNMLYIEEDNLDNIISVFDSSRSEIYNKIIKLYYDYKYMEKDNKELKHSIFSLESEKLINKFKKIGNISFLISKFEDMSQDELKDVFHILKSKHDYPDGDSIVIFASLYKNEKIVYIGFAEGSIDASEYIKALSDQIGGKGGGRKDFAQGGSSEVSKFSEFEKFAEKIVKKFYNN